MLAYSSIGLTSPVYAASLICWSQKDSFRLSKPRTLFDRLTTSAMCLFHLKLPPDTLFPSRSQAQCPGYGISRGYSCRSSTIYRLFCTYLVRISNTTGLTRTRGLKCRTVGSDSLHVNGLFDRICSHQRISGFLSSQLW